MKKLNYLNWQQLANVVTIGLMASLVVAIAYFANAKPVGHDSFSNTIVTEASDYSRTFEDSVDDQPLFLFTYLLNQHVPHQWQHVLNSNQLQSTITNVGYRARPRSPPFQA